MASYTIEYEEQSGVVVCRIEGFLTEIEAAGFDEEWHRMLIRAQRRSKALRIIFDNRRGEVLPASTIERMGRSTRNIYKSGDRTAILVSGSLHRIQAKRTSTFAGAIFESEEAARNWLCE